MDTIILALIIVGLLIFFTRLANGEPGDFPAAGPEDEQIELEVGATIDAMHRAVYSQDCNSANAIRPYFIEAGKIARWLKATFNETKYESRMEDGKAVFYLKNETPYEFASFKMYFSMYSAAGKVKDVFCKARDWAPKKVIRISFDPEGLGPKEFTVHVDTKRTEFKLAKGSGEFDVPLLTEGMLMSARPPQPAAYAGSGFADDGYDDRYGYEYDDDLSSGEGFDAVDAVSFFAGMDPDTDDEWIDAAATYSTFNGDDYDEY